MYITSTSQTSPAASAPHGGTEDRGIAACSLFQAINCDILHSPEGGWGRNGAPQNARGSPSVHSSSLSLLGLAGQAAAHREGSTRDATEETFLLPTGGEEPAIFSEAILTLAKATSLWALQVQPALASCCCSEPSILPQKSGPQKRICCSLLLFCKSRKLKAILTAACCCCQ